MVFALAEGGTITIRGEGVKIGASGEGPTRDDVQTRRGGFPTGQSRT
jgi:hypothetical protein